MNLRDADFTYDHKLGGYPSQQELDARQAAAAWMRRVRLLELLFALTMGGLLVCLAMLAT
jgi:hypothetical protein